MDKTAKAKRTNARVSMKDANVIFKKLRRKKLEKAKAFLQRLIDKKEDIDGKYYTGACKVILELLEDVQANAEAKNLDTEKLFIKKLAANKSFTFVLPKSRITHRGRRAKMCHLEVEVEER
ncbi:MAG: uL22 family ribosomal protein [Candidatus Aenigmatarchaeota archaeon]|nr:hypothetical protein [Candidatus Aenigmarchaeota archaeon]